MSETENGRDRSARIAGRAAAQLEALLADGLAPGLHIVATPIGNLGDVSLRTLAALASADVLLCEDTRRARKLLSHFGISRDVQVYEEHSAHRVRPRVLSWLRDGKSVALISDAGTPLVSDPGFKLVREALDEGISVATVPGPVAAVAALTISGLPTDSFFFAGFLPAKGQARRQRLGQLAGIEATLIFYESPARLPGVLSDMAAIMGGRHITIVREMTKRFETHYRGTVEELRAELEGTELKGEIVLMVEPPPRREVSDETILHQLALETRTMSRRDAVQKVANVLGVQRKRVYNLMVERGKG